MSPTKRLQHPAYLDHDKVKLLNELATETRIPKSVLLREAVDDLLKKYGKLKGPRAKT
jgi:predicted transcriptional regulator